jgi:dihydroorotate dehydrogenase (fumarate)
VLKSIFEEQFLLDERSEGTGLYPEIKDYLQSGGLLDYAPRKVVEIIKKAKNQFDLPLIASINCQSERGWVRFAQQLEDAGCDGLELNIYTLPLEPEKTGEEYERHYLRIVERVREAISLPLAVKIYHQITALPYFIRRLGEAGSQAVVLFNWFLEPDLDLQTLKSRQRKGQANFYLVLRWIGLLANRVGCQLAASGGVKGYEDVIKLILAGASAVQICSLFYQQGLGIIKTMLVEISNWLAEHGFQSIAECQGRLSLKEEDLRVKGLGEAEVYLRGQYIRLYSE